MSIEREVYYALKSLSRIVDVHHIGVRWAGSKGLHHNDYKKEEIMNALKVIEKHGYIKRVYKTQTMPTRKGVKTYKYLLWEVIK